MYWTLQVKMKQGIGDTNLCRHYLYMSTMCSFFLKIQFVLTNSVQPEWLMSHAKTRCFAS